MTEYTDSPSPGPADSPADAGASPGASGTDAGALAVEDRLPARQQPDAGDDQADDYGEADPDDGYDGDLDALTADNQAMDAGDDHAPDGTAGHQDQAAGEAPPVAGKPGDLGAEVPGASAAAAPEQEDGNRAAPEESPAGTPAETGDPAEANAAIRPGEAAQPADSHANPEADLKELKAEYEASLKDLKTEFQALKDLWAPVSDAPEGTRREAGQPYAGDRELTTVQEDERGAKPESDRPGLWSNAKSALYGAVGTTVTLAGADQFFPGAPHAVVDLATGALTIAAALVPTMREGWKRKHDDSQGKS